MRAGELDRKVDLHRNVDTGETTDYNEPIFEDQVIRTFRASMIWKSDDEQFSSSTTYSVRVVTFRCRFFTDLRASDTFVCEGVTYNILSWRELGRRAGLDISAKAIGFE